MVSLPSDRNLLAGVLALKLNLISRDQFVQAMDVWLEDPSRSISDILRDQGVLSELDQKVLEPILAEHSNRQQDASTENVRTSPTPAVGGAVQVPARDPNRDSTVSLREDGGAETSIEPTLVFPSTSSAHKEVPNSLSSRFRIMRPHAKGGLGEVFVARDLELNRDVALKEIQARFANDTGSQARFVAEAEITGGLEHPGIVPVYGLGRHADGRPYYAMRFIQGDSLQEAVDRFHGKGKHASGTHSVDCHCVDFRKLLGRFIDVCQAIEYAHSRGVLHRDLKPGNIMLGKYGETLVVDWGLAKTKSSGDASSLDRTKSLDISATGGDAATVTGMILGTPAYMPPEQAAGRLEQLGPCSDVYSLGATLYHLLTGRAPFGGRDLVQLLKQVQQGDFPTPRSIHASIPRALEAICLKAMAVRPEERFASPQEIADEVERYLADEPVLCCAEPWVERTARWVRRHRTLVTSAAVAVLLLTVSLAGGLALMTRHSQQLAQEKSNTEIANIRLAQTNQQLEAANTMERQSRMLADEKQMEATVASQIAEQQRDLAERAAEESRAVLRFFEEQVLAAARPRTQAGGLGVDVTIREAVEAAEPRIGSAFRDQPLVEASIRNTLGITYHYLGLADRAVTQHERARSLRETHLGADHASTLASISNLGVAYQELSDFDKALPLLRSSTERAQTVLGPGHPQTLTNVNNLATAYLELGDYEKALSLLEETLELREEQFGREHPETLPSLNNLALAYMKTGDLAKALPLFEETLELSEILLGDEHPDTIWSMNNLALGYKAAGNSAKAIPILEDALEIAESNLGKEHPETLGLMSNLGEAYRDVGKNDQALRLLKESFELIKRQMGEDHPDTLTVMNNLALAYIAASDIEKGLPLLEQALKLRKAELGDDHASTLGTMSNLSVVYYQLGDIAKALPLMEQSLEQTQKRLGAEHPDTLACMHNLTEVYLNLGEVNKARPLLEEMLEIRRKQPGFEHPDTLTNLHNLALVYHETGEIAKAVPLLEETLDLRKKLLGAEHPDTLSTMNNLALAYFGTSETEKGLQLLEETLALRRSQLGSNDPQTLTTLQNLAAAYRRAGQFAKVPPLFAETLEILRAERGVDHPETLTVMHNLGLSYYEAGDREQALSLFRETLELRKEKLGGEHPETLKSMERLAVSLRDAGEFAEAVELLSMVLSVRQAELGAEHPLTLLSMNNLAWTHKVAQELDKALPLHEQAAIGMEQLGFRDEYAGQCVRNAIAAYQQAERFEDADRWQQKWIAFIKSDQGAESAAYATELVVFGLALLQRADWSRAEEVLREGWAIRQKIQPEVWSTFSTQSALGGALLGQAKGLIETDRAAADVRLVEAEALLQSGYQGLAERRETISEQGKPRVTEALERLVDLYQVLEKPEEVAKWQAELEAWKQSLANSAAPKM